MPSNRTEELKQLQILQASVSEVKKELNEALSEVEKLNNTIVGEGADEGIKSKLVRLEEKVGNISREMENGRRDLYARLDGLERTQWKIIWWIIGLIGTGVPAAVAVAYGITKH